MLTLAPDAFLNARERFLETRDVRYAAIAIGKAPVGEYPAWAVEACRTYAASIGRLPSRSLEKGHSLEDNTALYERAYEDLIHSVLTTWLNQKPFKYAEAIKDIIARHLPPNSQGEEAMRRALRRRWQKDLDPAEKYTAEMKAAVKTDDLPPPADEANRHRRVQALFVMRGRGLTDL